MKKIIIIVISILLALSITASGIGYYFSRQSQNNISNPNNSNMNNMDTDNNINESNDNNMDNMDTDNNINESDDNDTEDELLDSEQIAEYKNKYVNMNEKDLLKNEFSKFNITEVNNFNDEIKIYEFSKLIDEDSEKRDILLILENDEKYKFERENEIYELKDNKFYVNNNRVDIIDINGNIKSIQKIFLNIDLSDCAFTDVILLLTTEGEFYYYNYFEKKIHKISSEYKFDSLIQVEFKNNEIFDYAYYYTSPELIARTIDGKLYSIENNKIFDYAYHYKNNNIDDYINLDSTLNVNGEISGYKVKQLIGQYILTTDNKIYSLKENKLVSENQIKNIYIKSPDEYNNYKFELLLVEYENNERDLLFNQVIYGSSCGSGTKWYNWTYFDD